MFFFFFPKEKKGGENKRETQVKHRASFAIDIICKQVVWLDGREAK